MANIIYNKFKEYCGDGTIDLDTHTFKCALLDNTHTPSAGYSTFAEVSSAEVSGTGYTAGGETLVNVSWGDDEGTSTFDADDVVWSDSRFTARYAVIYDDTTTTPVDALICMYDLTSDRVVNLGTFTLAFDSEGILKIE